MDYLFRQTSIQMEALNRLRFISLAEIIMACGNFLILFLGGKFKSTFIGDRYSWSWSWPLVSRISFDVLVFYTGGWGLFVSRTARQGVTSKRSFLALAVLNLLLCVISGVLFILLIFNAILTAALQDYVLRDPGHFWLGADLPSPVNVTSGSLFNVTSDSPLNVTSDSPFNVTINSLYALSVDVPSLTVVLSAYSLIGLFLVSLTVLTGLAATICRNNLLMLINGL